jgi:hypothetical protein
MDKLTQEQKIDQIYNDVLRMKKESKIQSIESKIQTIALIAVFVFGIATISDLIKKTKKIV